jgi:hypothetical protein
MITKSCLHGIRLSSSIALATFEHGLVHLSVPLPSRDENCRFTIKPISSTVGDFLDALKAEDRGIESAGIYTQEGVRIAGSTPIYSVLNQDFDLHVNDKKVDIQGLEDFKSAFESPVDDRLDQVKKLVAQLHSSLNITDHQLLQENRLQCQLETMRSELAPLENQRQALAERSHARTKRLTWIGLGLMGIQFGFLARLTWWEYSWDVMEPVTYFVTYGTVMGMYAYYCVTRQEYEFSAAYDREYLKWFYTRAKRIEFDVTQYNKLRESISQVESDLKRLRDPLQKNLPIAQPKWYEYCFLCVRDILRVLRKDFFISHPFRVDTEGKCHDGRVFEMIVQSIETPDPYLPIKLSWLSLWKFVKPWKGQRDDAKW